MPVSEIVPGGNDRVVAVAGDAADSPYGAAVAAGAGGRGPRRHAAWITYRHSHQPAAIKIAILHTPISNINNVIHDGECRSLLLDLRPEGHPVIQNRRRHVHGPAWIDNSGVHVNG